jgi:SRSO17 transposase
MSYQNIITKVVSSRLKNPIIKVLKDIKITSILKRSNFIKKDGASSYTILMHFIYMIIMNKNIASFRKYSKDGLTKDVYYRALKNSKYNWQKLLILSTLKLIQKVSALKNIKAKRVLILDDTIEDKKGKKIEGVCDKVWSNKDKKSTRAINMVSLNYNDGYTNFMIDFALKFNKHLKIKIEDFKNQFYHTSSPHKRKEEGLQTKLVIALNMVKRALKAGIKADYLLVDSWYSKPSFIKDIKKLKLDVISRIANNIKIWNFRNQHKSLNRIYNILIKNTRRKKANYNKIRYTYCSIILKHHMAGMVKIVFIKTHNKLIPILSTNINLTDEQIIEIYKRRWNIEQGYKELREHFGFGKEENRIYEALVARITLSFLSYNLVSYINRINNEPQTLGGLFKDLECELNTLAISMEFFIKILEEIFQNIENVQNDESAKILLSQIIGSLRVCVKDELGFMCES